MNEPQTADGLTAWTVIERCSWQVRGGFGSPYALDYTAILMMADAMGARTGLLAEMLPIVEPMIVRAYQTEGEA